MADVTSGKARARRAGPRTDVHPIPLEKAPKALQPSLRLLAQLAEIFPDQIIDIDEVPYISQED